MKVRISIILFIFFFCLLGLGFIFRALFPSSPDELNELSGTHYIEVKTWVKHKECMWINDLTINDQQKIASVTDIMQNYADDDWMTYMPSASGNLFVNFYNENEDRIFSLIVSSIFFEGKQSYILTQTNGPSISITESDFKALMTLLDVDENCATVGEGTSWRCPSLPEKFEEADLVGVWHSRYNSVSDDTIILQADGTYKQVYRQTNGYSYKSPWNRWHLEQTPEGGAYLHLKGMHYCLSIDEVCKREGGGGGDWPYYDPCVGHSVRMDDEVILALTGDEGFRYPGVESVPRGIILWHMKSDADSADNFFILEE